MHMQQIMGEMWMGLSGMQQIVDRTFVCKELIQICDWLQVQEVM
jgi:hypothetical protein